MNKNIKLKCICNANSPLVKTFMYIARPYMAETDPDKTEQHESFLQSMLRRQGELSRWLTLFMLGRECVGFAHFKIDHEDKSGWGYIMEYYIIPQRRREGFGRRYLSLVLDVLHIAGCRNIWLASHPNAETFWEACGFEETGEFENHQKIMIKIHKGTSNENKPITIGLE